MSTADPRKGPPPVPRELIDWLERTYPELCPDLQWPDRKVWHYAGQRELVRTLASHHKKQQTKD